MMKKKNIYFILLTFLLFLNVLYPEKFKIGTIQYNGGGDWYNDPSSIPNLLNELKLRCGINTEPVRHTLSLKDDILFSYPAIFLTGHGNIILDDEEIENLKKYLNAGGFLYVDDDYGIDKYIRREMKKVYPNKEWVELPFSHPIYHSFYSFKNGLPKIHEHDKKPPQGLAIMDNERVLVFYTYESNLADGWADKNVHNNTDSKRESAFKMGINIFTYLLNN